MRSGLELLDRYDDRLGYEHAADDPETIAEERRALGVDVVLLPADLADHTAPQRTLADSIDQVGPLSALAMSQDIL